MPMTIYEYINSFENKGEAYKALANALGRSEVTVRSWANGNRYPGRKLWRDIEVATDRRVTATDLLHGSYK